MSTCTRAAATRLWASARPAIVVTVSEARGSVPREAGTRMLVTADDAIGTIGGGHLELQAIAEARAMLAASAAHPGLAPTPRSRRVALGPTLGQCCGGAVTLVHAPLDAAALARWPESAPRFVLQLYGAGHVGRAIARALAPLDVRVDWIDEREDEFPRSFHDARDAPWPAHIRRVCVDAVEGEVDTAPPGAYYLVLTHRHDLDLRIVERILARGDFGFCGLIGSKTKRQRFIHRFEARGLPASAIARLTCPIGIAGIEGKEPEVIAASVVAQLLLASSATRDDERHAGCRTTVPFPESDDGCEEHPAPLVEARHRDE
ncbi:MAG TPA: xanthine dehydrogenase accessory protein XdhC [Caldimonas sp.]|nr:xanthine dehydrogenase accessory protein XdhC [Caldimonas sp.]